MGKTTRISNQQSLSAF